MVDELNLIDLWRTQNPKKSAFTHCSSRHKTKSRIGTIWTSWMGIDIFECEILPNIFADHNTVMLTLNKKKRNTWRLNVNHLKDQQFLRFMRKKMDWFFKLNTQPGMKMQNIWDTSKAYFRGIAIKNVTMIRRKREGEIQVDWEIERGGRKW